MITIRQLGPDGELRDVKLAPVATGSDDRADMYAELFGSDTDTQGDTP